MVVGQVYRYQLTENGQPELVLTKSTVNRNGNYNLCRIITTKRLATICHHQLYKKRMAKTYIRKVWSREFRECDLVLRKILSLPHEDHNKWTPNYECLYMVKKAFLGRALILTRIDREDVIRPVNLDFMKKYFV
jgi:hypothetical protein